MALIDDKAAELEDQLKDLDVERSLNYSLADAIREGSTVTDQRIGGWTDESRGKACALSAALIAVKARHLLD